MTTRQLALSTVVLSMALATGTSVLAQQLADEGSRREAVQFYRNGEDFMAAEKFERAAEEFTKAVKKDPLFVPAHYRLGQAYMNLRRYVSAAYAFKNCLDSGRRLYQLSATHSFEVERQRDDEIREMKDTIRRMTAQLGPGSLRVVQLEQQLTAVENQRPSLGAPFTPAAEVLLSLGSALFKSGDRAAAEAQWKAAIDANPSLGEAHNNLAVIYMEAGRYAEAEEELKIAESKGLRVNPQFKDDLTRAKAER
jgi:Tfp pilus assembly protein PilF